MADTIEEAYEEFCQRMSAQAGEARRAADEFGAHEMRITTTRTKKRGYVCEMTSREIPAEKSHGRLIDLK